MTGWNTWCDANLATASASLTSKVVEKDADNVTVGTETDLITALAKPYSTTITLTANIVLGTNSVPMNVSHTLVIPMGNKITVGGRNGQLYRI